jgi:hypothetical protein
VRRTNAGRKLNVISAENANIAADQRYRSRAQMPPLVHVAWGREMLLGIGEWKAAPDLHGSSASANWQDAHCPIRT